MQYEPFSPSYVTRLAGGDLDIERHFVRYFNELLLIKLRRRLRSREAIDDVRQETFLRVFNTLRRKGGLQHPERLGAFVNGVCNNVVAEHYRKEARLAPVPAGADDPPEPSPGVESSLVSDERTRQVRRVLDQLAQKDRELLRLVFFEERDKDEVCRQYGVDRNYLRVLLHRAKHRFRDLLSKEWAAPRGGALCWSV